MSSSHARGFALLTATAMLGAASAWWLGRPDLASPASSSSRERAASPGSSREEGPGVTAAQVNDLRRELEALRQQNQQLARRLDSIGARASPAAPSAEPPAAAPPPSPGELEARFAEKRVARFERLDTAFRQEAREASWAGKAESLVVDLLRQDANANSHLERVDCRTEVCRIELSHQDVESRGSVMEQFISTPGLQGQFVVQTLDAEMPPRSVIYLAREGAQLPKLGAP